MSTLKEILTLPEGYLEGCDFRSPYRKALDEILVREGFVDADGKPDFLATFYACPKCKQDAWALCQCGGPRRDGIALPCQIRMMAGAGPSETP